MKIGSIVVHSKLGQGIILEFRKYGGAMVDFSTKGEVLVRVVKVSDLEVKNDK